MIMSLITANTAGATKRTVINASFFVSYCVGNIIGPFAFKDNEAPVYTSGITAILVAYCLEVALFVIFAWYMMVLNRGKARESAEREAGGVDIEQEKAISAFSDLTDKENPYFKFTY
jgi:hypothetical protein